MLSLALKVEASGRPGYLVLTLRPRFTSRIAAHKFVAVQRSGNLKASLNWATMGAKHCSHAPELYGMRSLPIQSDNVLDFHSWCGLTPSDEKDASRTYVLRGPTMNDTCRPQAND